MIIRARQGGHATRSLLMPAVHCVQAVWLAFAAVQIIKAVVHWRVESIGWAALYGHNKNIAHAIAVQ